MSYTVPVFNLFTDVWFDGKTPATDAPDVENLPTQKYLYSRGVWDIQPCEMEVYTPPIMIRIPFTDFNTWESSQVFECPAESGRYYRARFKEIMHEGFSNQYLVAVVVQCTNGGIPLIRDIENAEPCAEIPPTEGEGEASITIAPLFEGEGFVGDIPISGEGGIALSISPDFEGDGTVT